MFYFKGIKKNNWTKNSYFRDFSNGFQGGCSFSPFYGGISAAQAAAAAVPAHPSSECFYRGVIGDTGPGLYRGHGSYTAPAPGHGHLTDPWSHNDVSQEWDDFHGNMEICFMMRLFRREVFSYYQSEKQIFETLWNRNVDSKILLV